MRGSLTTTEEVGRGGGAERQPDDVVTLPQPLGLAEHDRSTPRGFERALHRNQEIRGGHAASVRTNACGR